MRPNIDTHDYDVKMKAMNRFFEEGDKVKVTLKFRGREMAHQELGMKLLMQVKEDTVAIAKVEAEPKKAASAKKAGPAKSETAKTKTAKTKKGEA